MRRRDPLELYVGPEQLPELEPPDAGARLVGLVLAGFSGFLVGILVGILVGR